MKSHARVCIIGGGIMGVGLAYHLAEEGWRDIVLVEKGELTSGSTWHAAGQCPQATASLSLSHIQNYASVLYPKLEELTGVAVSWHGCGGIRLALSDDEVAWFKRLYGVSKLAGYEAHLIGPDEIAEHHPFLNTDGVKMGYLTVTDGHVAPADVTLAMAAGARKAGVDIYRRCQVRDVKLLASGAWQVITENGNIECEHVVNAAGSYADVVGAWSGHNVPIANMLHHYIITEPLQELIDRDKELPVVRDPYSHCYLREETHGVLVGPYETAGAHVCWDGQPPAWDFESELVTPELDRLMPWLEKATGRLPLFGKAGIKSVVSGAITHTPDANFLLGPAAGAANYWMSNGVSVGISQGAGAGKYLAQMMVHGQAEINMLEFDPRRFGGWADKEYATQTSIVDYQHMYYCYRPGEQHETCRPMRKTSLYDRLKARGGQFQEVFGWERVRWFDTSGAGEDYSFERSNWFEPVRAECAAVRERAGLMDLSTFAKFDVTGAGAQVFLERISANAIPARDGGVALCHLLTDEGFIDSEMTVTRLADGHYYVLAAATAQLHDMDKMRRGLEPDEDVTISDITGDYGCLVLSGPRARDILGACTQAGLGNDDFKWLTGKVISVAGVSGIRALRVSYVGELGWELHCPMADMPVVFDALMAAGEPHGLGLFGTYAMNALRMEKAYRGWGSELTAEVTMIEADMERFVRLDKDFTGKAGTLASKQNGPRTKLVYLEVDTGNADCSGNEPVYANDEVVGVTTSGGYGFDVEKSLAFAYVPPEHAAPGCKLSVLLFGEHCPARVIAQPAYDPRNERLRA